MKLEVGQFVRLKSGYICKIININDFREPNMKYGVEANYLKDVMFIGDDDVVKASYNIIDILEVGDYVNGVKVINIDDEWITMRDMQVPILKSIANGLIKSVITHEQMEQMEYKVDDI